MRKIVEKQNFLGGEAGPLLEGRSDLAQYQLGCSEIRNFIALKGGGLTRRPGTRWVKNTQGDLPARLIPFISTFDNTSNMYVLEITASTIRAINNSSNAVSTPTGAISGLSTDGIQYVQSADVLFLVDGANPPCIIYRTNDIPPGSSSTISSTALSFSEFSDFALTRFTNRPEQFSTPYRDPNIVTTHTMTINTASVGTGRTLTSSELFFYPSHIGAYFRVFDTGYVKITDVASVLSGGNYVPQATATVQVLAALDSTAATSNWAEGSWSDFRGWPRSITFYDGRLVFGGNTSQPDTFWASQVDDYFQMHAASDGITDPKAFTLRSDKLNQIKWMNGGKKLTIGTSSSEWVGTFSDDGTNFFIQFNEETKHGSRGVQPKKVGYSLPFIQRSGQTIREMTFDFDSDNYQATDLNLFASHIGTIYDDEFDRAAIEDVDSVLVGIEQQTSPFDILWTFDSAGRLYGLTRDKQQQIATWHSHAIAGGIESDVPGYVKSTCIMVSPVTGSTERLWLCVERSINGSTVYGVEYIDDFRDRRTINVTDDNSRNKSFLDCSTIQTGASSVSWSNLSRFANDSCYVIAQTATGLIVYCGEIAVNGSGEITLPTAATVVVAGLHHRATIRPLPVEGGTDPEIKGRSIKRIDAVRLKLYQTYGLRVGPDRVLTSEGEERQEDFELIPFQSTGYPILPTFTGTKEIPVPCDGADVASFALAMEEPWPCTILSISMRVVHNEV